MGEFKMRYLTNTDRGDDVRFHVEVAALRSGQNVKYIDAPMPPSQYEYNTYYYHAVNSGRLNHLASIVSYENTFDHSAFWEEYRKLEDDEQIK
jgi:hypothetical protein